MKNATSSNSLENLNLIASVSSLLAGIYFVLVTFLF